MNVYSFLLTLFLSFESPGHFTCAAGGHQLCFTYGCFDSSGIFLTVTLNDDEVCYADFKNNILVWDSKLATAVEYEWAYKYAEVCQVQCKKDIYRWKVDPDVRRTTDRPEIIIYLRNELCEDEENTLVCFINKFYPPALNISWTKNNKEVAVEDPFFKIVSNSDGTFHVFSYLNFVPKQGDIYSCTVKHEALEEPETRTWDVETEERSMGPTVFCISGLILGILGIAAGIFFFVK
ncbi:PREDICTED: H-2 class II histocompatibility antigen, A-U alpha chain-like [Cyprinodon variegatus]|uniref:H-2 class II histocompatibility antigen, A-U alpha chain-like n=1 Tax=Cyprinodon variegatus TaxID=28743 RepID=A0A3Q2D0D3_CYPVA|nr:PREDICTED: H-2 class II histocompatibility antigen, A-U alpha chain-like [Cyprinodon variegatus]